MPPLLRHRWSEDSESSALKGGKAMSMVSRVQERVDELRKNFGLPDGETFMDEFYCALHKKILFQGRMYIFEHYVCFYANLFGWVKRKAIPMVEITDVAKKRNYGFPNSIQIGWKGKREFFTSFLSRDDAYILIVNAWNQARLCRSSEQSVADHPHERRRHSEPGSPRSREPDADEEPPSDSLRNSGGSMTHRRVSSDLPDFHRDGGLNKSSLEHDTDSDLDDDDSDCWAIQPGELPPVPEAMDMIMEAHFPVEVREFFQKTLSSESIFLEEYHRTRGDQRLRLSQWQKHSGLEGMVRHSTFVSPVKAPGGFRMGISPKETECNQNHRYRVYDDGDSLVYETSQVMKDIPYGDNFTVEMRWDVTRCVDQAGQGDKCCVAIYGSVPFIRHVISPIRMMIESSVMKELRTSVAQLFENMRAVLAASSSQSITEPSVEAPIRAEYNMEELLSRQELRSKLLGVLRESLEESERIELLGKTSSVELPQLTESMSQPLQGPSLQGQPLQGQPLQWADRVTSYIPPGSMNVILLIGIALVFMFQILNLFLWLYPPAMYNRGYSQYPSDMPSLDRGFWRESLTRINQDLHSLQTRLEGLTQGVEAAMERLHDTKCHSTAEQ